MNFKKGIYAPVKLLFDLESNFYFYLVVSYFSFPIPFLLDEAEAILAFLAYDFFSKTGTVNENNSFILNQLRKDLV